MKIDYKKLHEGLEKLTGYDLEACEKEERLAGNTQMELSLSKSFQARLAARALDMNVHDLKASSLRDYNTTTAAVFSFLYPGDAQEPTT